MREFILTFCYSGKIKKAPGTFGSLASLIFWFFIAKFFSTQEISLFIQNIFWIIFLIAIFLYGIFNIKNYSKKFGQIDHSSIVLDEVLGQVLALQITFNLIANNYFLQSDLIIKHLLFCFILFRFFDIKKPSIIGWCDKNLKNSFGVMFDDLLCGALVALIGILIYIF